MSFLKPLMGAGPSRVSSIADRIGMGANQIAAAGGAQPGYAAQPQMPSPAPQEGDPNNHLQLLDPEVLQALVQRFRPAGQGVQFQ